MSRWHSAPLTRLTIALTALACWLAPAAAQSAAATPPKIDFAHDVVPVIRARCASCHTNGTYKGSFSLDTRETMLESEAVTPGEPAKSELIQRISSSDLDERMPPKEQRPLSAKEIDVLRAWIAQGAAWQPGFTFKKATYIAPLKVRRPQLPPARPGLEHPIDRILAAYFAVHQVTPPPALDDAAFARRLYLDVIGLLPAPAEVEAFAHDPSPD
ncbi:MAG TPA: c-type cytochrome domain-containing protein, partial [Pirellulales bacterium]|nr:c-type cytochrome domain-containing protein [Pirellulales bacterium]